MTSTQHLTASGSENPPNPPNPQNQGGKRGFAGFAGFSSQTLGESAQTVTPAQWLRELLECAGSGRSGPLYQCPAHPDPSPSLSIRDLPDGWAGVKCFAGCTTDSVLGSLKVTRAALARAMCTTPAEFTATTGLRIAFPPLEVPTRSGPGSDPAWRYESEHYYGSSHRLVRWRHPSGKKDLRWETRDQAGAWIPGLRGVPTTGLPLYLDHELRIALATGDVIHLVESESSADAFAASGRYATTWAGGAASPPLERLARELVGGNVVLVPDNDPPGLSCAKRITNAIEAVVNTLVVVLPDPDQDARDLLAADPARIPGTRP